MDEDGRPAHQAWLGSDSIYLSHTNPNVKADLDTFLLAVASQYLGTCQREIKKAFPHTLFIGPNSIGSWGRRLGSPSCERPANTWKCSPVQAATIHGRA